jgi:hypothetical protein
MPPYAGRVPPCGTFCLSDTSFVCNALHVSAGGDIRIARFDHPMQDAFRLLVLDGMAERWGPVDESLNADLDDIDTHYGIACSLPSMVP